MTSTTLDESSHTDAARGTQAGTGQFMLTLCRLAAPVSIRPPQSPQLKPFTFFTSCARQPDGSERLYLHMGYFRTLADAERWVVAVRGRYPHAFASLAPAASQRPNSDAPALLRADSRSGDHQGSTAPVGRESLTDTQVLKILEARRAAPVQDDVERSCEQVELVRPEDTSTRHALKEAVAQGAPVPFAIQLQWSAERLDMSRVPALTIFKSYTLYATESRRDGHSRYFLRLGFFADPISAKQVAAQVRSSFASAAVVPVTEQEVTRAREAATGGTSSIPYLAHQQIEQAPDSNGTSAPVAKPNPLNGVPRRRRVAETLEQTLEQLARRELWTDPDALSETGVRHLKVEVQEYISGRPPTGRT